MLVKLVDPSSIEVGDKLLRRIHPEQRGFKVVEVIQINEITNNHRTIICDDDLVFARNDMKLIRVIAGELA